MPWRICNLGHGLMALRGEQEVTLTLEDYSQSWEMVMAMN